MEKQYEWQTLIQTPCDFFEYRDSMKSLPSSSSEIPPRHMFGTYFNWSDLTFCLASSGRTYQPCFTPKLDLATNIPGFTSLVAPLRADVPLLDVVPLFAACETPCCPEVQVVVACDLGYPEVLGMPEKTNMRRC